ncbi:hypothetical protein [Actinomadura rubrisoli]|uniref:Major capsid protein n=1 Tax=Actinomadura rubrisoli TaxID=2530368 RepID=A0A4V2YZL6_9ACTN|nr:hypothetical protein [Actinomadura rubrisoli]TDD97167.1 hypothetical protein E1298_01660 [Actinomadura rubrisoli]
MAISNFPNSPLGPTTNIKTGQAKWVTNGALGLLMQDLVLANMVWKDASFNFDGSIGEVVNIKRPTRSMGSFDLTPFQHNDYLRTGANISDPNRISRPDAVDRSAWVPDHIEETYIQVRLDEHRASAHYISDEQMTFDVDSFAAEVLNPQTRGLAEYFEWRLAKAIMTFYGPNATPANERVLSVKAEIDLTATTEAGMRTNAFNLRTAIIDARKAAKAVGMPQSGQFLLCTPEVEAIILKDPDFQRVDYTGTSQALREAVIGKLYGLWIVTSNELAAQTATGLAMFLWHPTALAMVTKAPNIPKGVSFGAGASSNGVALRWLIDYDYTKMQDRSILDVYAGFNAIPEDPRYIADMKLRLPKLALGVTVPAGFDVMRCVRIDLVDSTP